MGDYFEIKVGDSKVKTILHDRDGDYTAMVSYDNCDAGSMINAINNSIFLAREDKKEGWPKSNDTYYTPDFSKPELVTVENWNASSDLNLRANGLVFKKKDEAIIAAKKMLEAIQG